MMTDILPDLPGQVPVMALGDSTLFPHALMPMFIFEERYQQMLRDVLETDRMFSVGLAEAGDEERIAPVAGVGLVRACVKSDDGTSHLILQGVGRVRILGWIEGKPYRVARVETLESTGTDDASLPKMTAALRAAVARMRAEGAELPVQLEQYLERIEDPGVLTDVVSSALIHASSERQAMLRELHVPTRLDRLIALLKMM